MNTEPLCLFIGLFKKTPITKVGAQYCTTRHNLLHKHIVRVSGSGTSLQLFTEYIYFTNRSVLGAKTAVTGATSQVVFMLFYFCCIIFQTPLSQKSSRASWRGPPLLSHHMLQSATTHSPERWAPRASRANVSFLIHCSSHSDCYCPVK